MNISNENLNNNNSVTKNKIIKGIIFIILSALSFAIMNVLVRLSGDLPSMQKSFFRNFVSAIFASIILFRSKDKFKLRKKTLKYHLMRSIFGTVGIICNFYAIDHMLLADATMLNKLAPFFTIIFSYFVLKEKVNIIQSVAVIIAFAGALFIIKPMGVSFSIDSVVGILGGMGAGSAYTFVRLLSLKGERSGMIVFFFSVFSCLVTLPFLIFDFHPMELWQILTLLGAGLAASGGQFTLTAACSYAPAKDITVFNYTQIIFAALMGLVLFGEKPDIFSIIGYIVIIIVSVFMFLYNKKRVKDK